jgi:hypothetical protein
LHSSASRSLKDGSIAVMKCEPVPVTSPSRGRSLSGLPVLRLHVPKNKNDSADAGFPKLLVAIGLAFSVAESERVTTEPMVVNPTRGMESVTLADLLREDDRTAYDERLQSETGEYSVSNQVSRVQVKSAKQRAAL